MQMVEVKGEFASTGASSKQMCSCPLSANYPIVQAPVSCRLEEYSSQKYLRRGTQALIQQPMDQSPASPGAATRRRIMVYRAMLLAGFVLVLTAALSIPIYWETTTLWYKVGIDKTMLKGGQYVGLTALVLIYLQVILSTRGAFMEQVCLCSCC